MKKITSYDQHGEKLNIEEIKHLDDKEQAEVIADKFTEIPNEYEALKTEDIAVPDFSPCEIPQFEPSQV